MKIPIRSEASIERMFTKMLRDAKLKNTKMRMGEGWPDRLVLLPSSRVMWVELKREDAVLSALQAARVDELRAIGHDVRVCHGPEAARTVAREIIMLYASMLAQRVRR